MDIVTIAYLKKYVQAQISSLNLLEPQVEQDRSILSGTGEPGVLYIIPSESAETNNAYDEYIYVEDWEKLGTINADLPKLVTVAVTLPSSGWDANATQTVNVAQVTATNTVFVTPDGNYADVAAVARIRAIAQGAGTLTFKYYGEAPESDVVMNVMINNSEYINGYTPYVSGATAPPTTEVSEQYAVGTIWGYGTNFYICKSITQSGNNYVHSWGRLAYASAIPTSLADLSDDSTHRVVTDTQIASWDAKANASAIPDELADLSDDSTHRLVTDAEKTAWNAKASASSTSVELAVADWDSTTKTQTVSVTGVTATNNVFPSIAPASMTDAASAQIYCSAQGDGTLTFTCATVPESAITVNVFIIG